MSYQITWDCPRCNKRAESFSQIIIPPPTLHCGDCLMDRTEVVRMRILSVDNVPPEPMVNIKVVDPDGEKIEGEP